MVCGDLGAVAKLNVTVTNDTLGSKSNPILLAPTVFPKPQLTLGIAPKARGDEEKISSSLSKLRDEDPVISFYQNAETGQMLISGLGDQHIDVIVNKLKNRYGVSVQLEDPKSRTEKRSARRSLRRGSIRSNPAAQGSMERS